MAWAEEVAAVCAVLVVLGGGRSVLRMDRTILDAARGSADESFLHQGREWLAMSMGGRVDLVMIAWMKNQMTGTRILRLE